MEQDSINHNGCSTCQAGSENWTTFDYLGNVQYQYDYRHPDGRLFSCVSKSLDICRAKRNLHFGFTPDEMNNDLPDAQTKTSKAISLYAAGRLKEALAIFSTFRVGFTKDEQRTLQIAHESLCGNSQFYADLGIDTEAAVEESKRIISRKYVI